MKLNFDLNNSVEKTEIVLGKKNYDKFGSITNITDLTYDYNLMSANSINFIVHKTLNNKDERLWNQIRDRRLIWVKEYDEWFEINVNINEENELIKEVVGTSLCEVELGQIKVNSTEINTENDIARDDYKNPTVFYKPSNPKESLLHRILKKAPNYSIDHVDETLWNIQRTFSFDGSSLYDVLTGEITEEIGCLFLFDSTNRTISVYDLQTNCLECGHRGDFTDICPECGGTNLDYGYGYDTSIFVDSENLAQNISLTGKQDDVKNYIKVSGGDDVINTAIAACNPTGTQYIFAFSEEDKEDMSYELSSKLDEYLKEYDKLTPTYKDIMLQVYNKIDEQLELESNMMPDIEQAETNAELELAKLNKATLSPIAVQDVSVASIYTVNNAVLGMAKCIVNSTVYKIEIIDGSSSFENQTWKGKFRLENYSDEEDFAESDEYIELKVNDDYAYYIEQKVQKTIDRNDIYLVDIFDVKTDLDVFVEELKKYCLSRLKSFESAYQSVIDVMIDANVGNDSTYGDIYNDLYVPYYNKLVAIQKEVKIRQTEIETVEKELEELEKAQYEITSYLNLENYLGEDLWKELCAFRREDTYENSNYISDGLDNTEILEKAQELLDKARNELVTSSTTQWSLSTTLYNLLAMPEFQKLTGMFNGGNWIRAKIDDKIYRLRLVHYRIQDEDIQNLEVEFSDVIQTANGLNDLSSLKNKVQSMSTNFSYIAYQAEQGQKSFEELYKIRNDGLNAALYNISNSINQNFIIDEHGITGRMYDDILGDYAPEQTKWINNALVFTDDYWVTAKCALGKFKIYNPILKAYVEQYGLAADFVIAGLLMGNDIIGGDIYSENYSTTSGTHIDLNTGDFTFAGGKLTYNTTDDLLTLEGKIIANDGGEIGGWIIDTNKIYMLDSGMSSDNGYYAFWAGETNGKNGLVSTSNAKFTVSHEGKLNATDATIEGKVTTNDITATYGHIANWLISGSTISSSTGWIKAGTSTDYVSLNNGALKFYSNGNETASFSDTTWSGTNTYGTAVHSEVDGKFISFGNKSSSSDTSYVTKFLINYGLNPNGRTDDVQVFGSLLSTGGIVCDGSYLLNNPGVIILTSGRVTAWDGTAWGINNSKTGTGLYVFGNIGCSGTKERIIQTEHYGAVELNAYETATPYFGDIGSGQCDENGLCYIYFDEIFKEVILVNCDYYIFLQQYGETFVYPIEKEKDYFVVKGEPYQKFDFEIKARQYGTENMRLNRAGDIIESEEENG